MDFFTWLFNTREGVIALCAGGLVICLLVAFVLEKRTKRQYFNHEKQPGEEDGLFEGLFGSDEDE